MAIRWDKFTVKSQEAAQAANQMAAENGNPEMLPLHLLAALLADQDGMILPVLEKLGVPTTQLDGKVNEAIARLPKIQGGSQPGMSQALQKVFDQARKRS
jgi:ATP-dependent Clp protease ATP-binding subunit ClpB